MRSVHNWTLFVSLPSYIKDTNHAFNTFRDFNLQAKTNSFSLWTQLSPTTKDSWYSNIFLTNVLSNNLAPKRLFASLNSFSRLTAFRSRYYKLTESLWALKWDLVMLTFLSASSNTNFSTNSTAPNRNFTGATSMIALVQHLCSRQELDYFIAWVILFIRL